jgi:dTDP-4-amino-4,6-dideoxygalactose transaminase
MPSQKVISTQARLARKALIALAQRSEAVLTGRAAAGIWAALTVWGLAGRTVLLPANTCYIVLWAVQRAGCRPHLVDIDAQTGNLTPAALEAAQVERPAAVIPCHLYGLPAPMAALTRWAQARGVLLIEDAAQAVGGMVDGRPAGAWGDAAVYSFGAGKILDQGMGGALLTNDPAFAREAERLLRSTPVWSADHAAHAEQWAGLYWALHQHEAANPRLPTLYPDLYAWYGDLTVHRVPESHWGGLVARIQALPAERTRREMAAARYDALLARLPDAETLPRPPGTMLWRYPLLTPDHQRDALLAALWDDGQHAVTRWYPALGAMTAALLPDVPQPPTPHADHLAARIINLPLDGQVSAAALRRAWRVR